jgi:uncharacterized protein (TIGR03437 family)
LNQEAVLKSLTRILLAICLGSAAALAQTPVVPAGGVGNAAGVASSTAVAPGSLVSIYGSNLANDLTQSTSIPLSTSLDNASVTFNNIQAPLLFVFSGQINAQVPYELANATSASVVVTNNKVSSAPVTVQLAQAVPGIFALAGNQAVAYGNSDGAFAAATGAIPGANSHPAKIGDPTSLVILATGLGPVNPPIPTGGIPPAGGYSSTPTMPTVTVGGVNAQVIFSGIVGFVGVYQINIVIQPGTPTGNAVPIQITMNGVKSNAPTIAVSN